MHWKRYKGLPKPQKNNESFYIIGLDIGNDSSSISFFNLSEGAPEIIDISGGYGRPSIPTVMQYIAETREWVYGEYAILNRGLGREITLSALIERLGAFEYIDLDNKPFSVVQVLGLFIKEMMSNVRNINPKAEVVGIVAAVPSYFSDQAREELTRAFKAAGYEKELIGLVSDRECVYTHYYLSRTPQEERGLLIDYGSRGVRGGVYHVIPQAGGIELKSMSSLFDDQIGTKRIDEDINALFSEFYADNTQSSPRSLSSQTREQIQAFAYQHKDILFQKNIRTKPVKLYFNFAYPPFQQTVTGAQMTSFTRPYQQQFECFIHDALEKNLYEDEEITPEDISFVVCVGGGFEMLWAREAVTGLFPHARVQFYRNAKVVTAEGAAIMAAYLLDACDTGTIKVEDKHQLREDIGLAYQANGRERFIPLAERNAFWWQKHPARLLLFNTPCEGSFPLTMAARGSNGETRTLAELILDGLPARPKGTTRLSVQLHFNSDRDIMATVRDMGFGELFPSTNYERKIAMRLI